MEGICAIPSRQRIEILSRELAPAALSAEAALLRREIVIALYHASGGHYGGCLSVIDILLALYRCELHVSPDEPHDPERDRLILSKGHSALALYAVLHRLGFWRESLNCYADFVSPLEGHPDMTSVPGVDFSTGSLGQGLSVGVGMALGLRAGDQRVWVVLGDGECQEGQVWEAAMLAASCSLDNLHAIVDCNRLQEWGRRARAADSAPEPVPDQAAKWRSFGWHVIECNGHDFMELLTAFDAAKATRGKPSVILANTVKGRGVPLIELQPVRFHCDSVSEAEHAAILAGMDDYEAC